MRFLSILFIFPAFLATGSPALASGSYGHGSGGIFYGSSFSGHYGNHYAGGYRGHGYSHGVRYGHSGYGHGSNSGWYFLGGMLLGGLLTHGYHSSRYQTTYVSQPRVSYYSAPPVVEKRVIYSAPAVRSMPVARAEAVRRFHRDLEGRCYEIRFNDEGDELRIELPAADCDWG